MCHLTMALFLPEKFEIFDLVAHCAAVLLIKGGKNATQQRNITSVIVSSDLS